VPRAGLTTARVVDAAAELADQVGLAGLTLSALAEDLGVRQPSLYKHIDGADGLRRALSLRAKGDLAEVLSRASVGRAGGDAVRALARGYRDWAREHPGMYEALVPAPDPGDRRDVAASDRIVSLVTDVLAGFSLRDDAAIHATRALRACLHGFVTLERSGGFGLPVDLDASFARMVDGLVLSMESTARSGSVG